MSVITIRGQHGSGAEEIGPLVAGKIGGGYADREIIAQVAQKLDLSHEHVEARESPPTGLLGRIAQALERSMAYGGNPANVYAPTWQVPVGDVHYLETLTSVINDLAEDPNIVIRGRGSQFILKNRPTAFHVLVVAPLEVRVRRVMESMGQGMDAAKKEVESNDSSRRAFIRRYFNANLEDPVHYHMVINTWRLGYEAAAQIIVGAATYKH